MELSGYRIMLKGKNEIDKAEVRLHTVRYAQRYGNTEQHLNMDVARTR